MKPADPVTTTFTNGWYKQSRRCCRTTHSLGELTIQDALVTGAAGFIGCHLAERLVVGGCAVRAVDNERSGDWNRLDVPVEKVHADLTELGDAELESLCRGVDVVYHLAAEKYNSSKSTPQKVIDLNVSATRRLYDAAARAGVRKVVFASSLYAYGSMGPGTMRETDVVEPTTSYGISKVAGEHFLRELERLEGLRWAVARLFFVYGPRQYAGGGYKSVIMANFERILHGEHPTIYGDGAQALDYVYVDDVVDGLIALAAPEHDRLLVNLCSGRAVSVAELTRLMLDIAGSDLEPVLCPPDWTAGSRRVGSPDAAAGWLGWRAATSLEDGVARVWDWLARSGAGRAPEDESSTINAA